MTGKGLNKEQAVYMITLLVRLLIFPNSRSRVEFK